MLSYDLSELNITCAFCRRFIVSVRCYQEASPAKGDYLFCTGCGEVSVLTDRTAYRKGWTTRAPTKAERFLMRRHEALRTIEGNWFDQPRAYHRHPAN